MFSSAIVGASTPDQIKHSAAASGLVIDDDALEQIDTVLAPIIERDPAKTPAQPSDYYADPQS